MNGSHESEPIARPMRPQYHFFYGSTSPSDDNSDFPRSSTNTEQESLIGEALVPTDNEEETPVGTSDSFDLQQVLISNGDNGGMRHVVGAGQLNGGSNHKRSSSSSSRDEKSRPNAFLTWRENHPMVHIIGLVGCMTVCMVIFAITLFPTESKTAADALGASKVGVKQFIQTFPIVDRSKSNDPAHLFLQKDLFHPDLHYQGTDAFREFNFAFPTGAFWTNLVLPPTADRGFSYPIVVYPYAYKWSHKEMIASYPSLHRKEESKAIHDYFQPDLTFGVTEDVKHRYITNFDPLSVALQFSTSDGKDSGSWKTYLVQGSPYVTIEYDNVTPRIRALSTFKNVVCPGEEGMESGQDDAEFDDSFSDDDEDSGGRRRLLGVCGVSTDDEGKTVLRGVQFVLQSQEGVNWIAFSSEPISFIYDTRIRTEVVSSRLFKGTIRLAIIPPASKVTSGSNGMVQISSSTGLRRLVYHASVYPVGAKVDYSFEDPTAATTAASSTAANILTRLTGSVGGGSGVSASPRTKAAQTKSSTRVASVNFRFQTKTANSNANTAAAATGKTTGLLMLSLPHHAVAFTKSHILDSKHFDLAYQCIKGKMTPVVGSVWTFQENLLNLGFDSEPTGDSGHDSSSRMLPTTETVLSDKRIRNLLADNLETDLNIAPPTRTENVYGFGKQVARLAQLAHIADKLVGRDNEPDTTTNMTASGGNRRLRGSDLDLRLVAIRQTAMEKLFSFLDLLLSNGLSDSLLYDASLGGIISTDGLADFNADFGNGRYNDHHFHYGYLMYASAVMGRLNATFVKEYGDKVDAIMHDVAHNANVNDGSFFPLARHMSWFDGHSYASGLFPYGNGKSQESSSEAVNCYYGAYLWSLVRSGSAGNPSSDVSAITDFARLLLAMEVRGAQTYWHMLPPSSLGNNTTTTGHQFPQVYSPKFAKNYMVGNVGMLDAICSTWFGTENLYVHMINFMPVTAVTRDLFNKEYVTQEYANVISQYPQAEMAWRGYVVSDHALVEPMKAWVEALKLISAQLDSGLSKTQALYFILTSNQFDLSQITSDTDFSGGNSNGSSSGSGDAECVNHDECLSSGLQGLCCPTPNGVMLGCCDDKHNTKKIIPSNKRDSAGKTDDASCSNHASCQDGGLTGLCCPTSSGVFLGCCNRR